MHPTPPLEAGFVLQFLTNINHCETYKSSGFDAIGVSDDSEEQLRINESVGLLSGQQICVPPWSRSSFSKNYRDFELSSLGILVFRGTFGAIRPNFDPFRPIPTVGGTRGS